MARVTAAASSRGAYRGRGSGGSSGGSSAASGGGGGKSPAWMYHQLPIIVLTITNIIIVSMLYSDISCHVDKALDASTSTMGATTGADAEIRLPSSASSASSASSSLANPSPPSTQPPTVSPPPATPPPSLPPPSPPATSPPPSPPPPNPSPPPPLPPAPVVVATGLANGGIAQGVGAAGRDGVVRERGTGRAGRSTGGAGRKGGGAEGEGEEEEDDAEDEGVKGRAAARGHGAWGARKRKGGKGRGKAGKKARGGWERSGDEEDDYEDDEGDDEGEEEEEEEEGRQRATGGARRGSRKAVAGRRSGSSHASDASQRRKGKGRGRARGKLGARGGEEEEGKRKDRRRRGEEDEEDEEEDEGEGARGHGGAWALRMWQRGDGYGRKGSEMGGADDSRWRSQQQEGAEGRSWAAGAGTGGAGLWSQRSSGGQAGWQGDDRVRWAHAGATYGEQGAGAGGYLLSPPAAAAGRMQMLPGGGASTGAGAGMGMGTGMGVGIGAGSSSPATTGWRAGGLLPWLTGTASPPPADPLPPPPPPSPAQETQAQQEQQVQEQEAQQVQQQAQELGEGTLERVDEGDAGQQAVEQQQQQQEEQQKQGGGKGDGGSGGGGGDGGKEETQEKKPPRKMDFLLFSGYRSTMDTFVAIGNIRPNRTLNDLDCWWRTKKGSRLAGRVSVKRVAEMALGPAVVKTRGKGQEMAALLFCILEEEANLRTGGALRMSVNGAELLVYEEDANPGYKLKFAAEETLVYDVVYCSPPLHREYDTLRLYQWVEYHRKAHRIDFFQLYDAGGVTDDFLGVAESLVNERLLAVLDMRMAAKHDPFMRGQLLAAHDCLYFARTTARWALFLDVDEYLFVTAPPHSIHATLTKHKRSTFLTVGSVRYFTERCAAAPEGEEFNGWEVERMVFRDPNPTCTNTTMHANRNLCLDDPGNRKYIVDPRKTQMIAEHRVLEPRSGGTHLDAGEVRIGRFPDLPVAALEPCGKVVKDGDWIPPAWTRDTGLAKLAERVRLDESQ
ncbi:hypothetical protein CLOP_g20342 [Closterium sp. NIES-67]|nr:hypothetical protein CLOP_g20342 [Closterium sp. NIES-67]